MTQEEIQKQIEAVRGLIEVYNSLELTAEYAKGVTGSEMRIKLLVVRDHLRTLTETLKPHLNGEKLEV